MYLNTGKKLIVLLEKDFKDTLQNKTNHILCQRQEFLIPKVEIKQEINNELEYINHGAEPKSRSDKDEVVEILVDDIIDISDDDTEFPQDAYKWEEDEWYKIVNIKQESEISNNFQLNCELINNEDVKPAFLNEIEKSNNSPIKVRAKNEKVKGIQLRESDDDNDNLDPFAESDDSDYIPEEADESDGEGTVPDDQLSSDVSEGYVDAAEDPNFGQKTEKKERKKKIFINVKNRLSEDEMKIIQKARFFVCTLCNAQLKRESERTSHRKSHGMRYLSFETRFRCPECLQVIQGCHGFKVHYQMHVGKKIFTGMLRNCAYCPYKTSRLKDYKSHQLGHTVKSEFRCEFCSYSTTCKTMLTKHLKLHNKFSSGVYSCELCAYSSKLTASLRKHVKAVHLSNEEKDWIHCPYCPFRAVENHNVKKHLKCHEQNKNYKCPQCTYSSDCIIRVKSHLKLHYDKKEDVPEYNIKVVKPVVTCPECPYKTDRSEHMKRHNRVVHGPARIKCADCPFSCKDKADMIKHVNWHKKEAPLKCRWCSFRHDTIWAMTKHERLHFDTRLSEFENSKKKNKELSRCPICQAIFNFPSQVKMHMTKHKTLDECEDPVYCANCPYKSKSKDLSFIKHVLCHLKKDGIKCDFCTFRHDLRRVITIHVRLHNNIKEEVNEDGENTPA